MPSSQRIPLVASLALALVVAFVLLLLRTPQEQHPAAPTPVPTPTSGASTEVELPSSEGAGDSPSAREAAPTAVAESERARTRPARRVILTGFVTSNGAPIKGDADVIVMRAPHSPEDRTEPKRSSLPAGVFDIAVRTAAPMQPKRSYAFGVAAHVDSKGSYRLDISRYFGVAADGDEHLTQQELTNVLWVKVSRVGEAPSEFDAVIANPGNLWLTPEDVELIADFELTGSCTAVGAAWAEDQAVDQVMVSAFELVDGKPAASPAFQYACQAPRGEFGLPVDCEREYAVVAYAEGYRPQTRIVSARTGLQLGDFVLEHGASISGFARVAGDPVRGMVKVELAVAESRELVPRSSVGSQWLAWVNGSFEWDASTVSSDNDGAFEIRGLGEFDYRISLRSSYGVYSSRTETALLHAPASDADLSPRVCRIDLRLFHLGRPALNTTFEVSEVDVKSTTIGSHRTDATGAAVLWVDPERETTIGVTVQGADGEAPTKTVQRVYCPGPGQAAQLRLDF